MAEKRHIWLFGDQKARHSHVHVTRCPLVAAIGITYFMRLPIFLLQITSSSPVQAAVPAPLVTASAPSLFTCKLLVDGCRRKQNRVFTLRTHHTDQIFLSWDIEHFRQKSFPSSSLCPHDTCKPACNPFGRGKKTSLAQTQTYLCSVLVLEIGYCSLLDY